MPKPIPGQQQRDEGDSPTESPNVDVQTPTSVVSGTIKEQPSPALKQLDGSNNTSNNGSGQNKSGLQPPPAVMQWVQSMLVNLEVAWMVFYPAVQWVRGLVGRKTPDKLASDDEKPDSASQADSASQDSEDDDAQSGESTVVASTTNVSQAAKSSQSGDGSVPPKDPYTAKRHRTL